MLSFEYGCRVALINPDEKEDKEDIELLRLITSLFGGNEPLTDAIEEESDDLVVDALEE